MAHDTAGDPITGLKWTRKTTEKVAHQLGKLGIRVDAKTVGRILKKLGYSLRVNSKKISSGSGPDRNTQFEYINSRREQFMKRGVPVLSVDTKKKELVGNFKNNGVAWEKAPVAVHDHDFRSMGKGVAVPYGIYDVAENLGSVYIGTSYDTPEFAVDSLEKWCRYDGQYRYKNASELLILADGGGSNGYRCRAWKVGLQRLADKTGITFHVSHYPPGASKWNPIEHRLFSEISKNWAGRPLDSLLTIQNYISTTTTSTGLRVKAYVVSKRCEDQRRRNALSQSHTSRRALQVELRSRTTLKLEVIFPFSQPRRIPTLPPNASSPGPPSAPCGKSGPSIEFAEGLTFNQSIKIVVNLNKWLVGLKHSTSRRSAHHRP